MEYDAKHNVILTDEEQMEKNANLSVTSFILSMVGLIAIPTVVGLLVLGILAFTRANKVAAKYNKAPYRAFANLGRGFGLFEIILAGVCIAAALLYLFIMLIVLIASAGAAAASY